MNDTEREAIILNTVWVMIDDMVNWAMFAKVDEIKISNLMFKDSYYARLFVILLVDFLSEVKAFKGPPPLGLKSVPSGVRSTDRTMLFHLRDVITSPRLGSDTAQLATATEAFGEWLEKEFTVDDVNFYKIGIVANIRISRLHYLKICGDLAKHNLARLEPNMQRVKKLLEQSGHVVTEQEAYLAIENFGEWFLDSILIYHASQIGEFLNNIRWAIYEYLQPEFRRSFHRIERSWDPMAYAYRVPSEIKEDLAVAMYWDAMNRSRSRPYVQQFEIDEILKRQY